MRRGRILKKRYTMSVLGILIPVVVLLFVMNIGYSLWSSKLNIHTNVELDYKAPALDVDVPKKDNGQYVATSGFANATGGTTFDLVSEKLSGNSLTTTIKVHKEKNVQLYSTDISIGFSLKNVSDGTYTDGKVTQKEVSDSQGSFKRKPISAKVLPTTVLSGSSAEFEFSGRVDCRLVTDVVYYTYDVTYDVGGITKHFYYTLKILPPDEVS